MFQLQHECPVVDTGSGQNRHAGQRNPTTAASSKLRQPIGSSGLDLVAQELSQMPSLFAGEHRDVIARDFHDLQLIARQWAPT